MSPGDGRSLNPDTFNSRGFTAGDILARPLLRTRLHTVSSDEIEGLDFLTYEVVRHRLSSITEEMADAIKRMSGSIVVTDANDFDFAISDEVGASVQIALYNTELAACIDLAINWTLRNRDENPGIEDGDMFLSNDPWVGGGLHQNDVSLIQPIFWEGELFCWTSAIAHQIDLGGVSPGSRSPRADSVYWEALPTPPIKVVRNGRIQRDVEDAYVRPSRVADLVSLDLRAKYGANLLGRRRILELVSRYGASTVKAVMKQMMNDAENRLRDKLRSLPDGTWHSTQYIDSAGEGDRGVYSIRLKFTKKDDRLTFDFRETDTQVGMINATWAGCRGGVVAAVLPMLAGDIPWSPGGLLRCIDIVTEPGTIVDADFPAAVAKAPVGAAMATSMAAVQCLSKLFGADPRRRRDLISVCGGTADVALFSGTTDQGRPFMTVIAEHMATGLGARSYGDGVDLGGMFPIPMGRVPDAEMTEFLSPMLYVWRREEMDSGGPGKFRGGLSGSVLMVPHSTQGPVTCVVSGAGKAVSQNRGIAGGYPGNQQRDLIIRSSNVKALLAAEHIPEALEEIAGLVEVMPAEHQTHFNPGDAYFMHWQGGGGYMDPLLRDPALVTTDVDNRRVSVPAANDIYGVILDKRTGAPDLAATNGRRQQLRTERGRRAGVSPVPDSVHRQNVEKFSGDSRALSENLVITTTDGEGVTCAHCLTRLAADEESLLAVLATYEGPAHIGGPRFSVDPANYTDEQVVFRQVLCPACLTAFESQVVLAARVEYADKTVIS